MIVAHGIGGRQDLPIPFDLALWGSAAVLLVTFAGLAALWRRPRLRRPEAGVALPAAATRTVDSRATRGVLRGLALLAVSYVALAAFGGPNDELNPTAGVVYVYFWVGLVVLSLLVGPVWRVVNPLRTLHVLLSRAAGRDPEQGRPYPARLGMWPAAVGLLAFGWLELVLPADLRTSTVVLRSVALGYAVVMLAGAAVYGSGWFARADAFEVWFTLVGRLAPLARRRSDGLLVLRSPLVGLAQTPVVAGLAAVVVASLGTTAYDGFSKTDSWVKLAQTPGRPLVLIGTGGLLGAVLLVALTYVAATAAVGRDGPAAFAPSMLPIAVGYVIAHYFSLLLFEGQRTLLLLSDPLGTGANWLGTGEGTVDYTVLGVSTIAAVRAGAVVVGHVVAVVVAHDTALELADRAGTAAAGAAADETPRGSGAVAAQLPLLLTMVGYTLAALLVLLR